MVSEYVLIDIAGYSAYELGHANVTAQFFMRNLGQNTEKMRVRFPMNHGEYDIEYELTEKEEICRYSVFPSIEKIRVWVDGQEKVLEITQKTLAPPDAPEITTVPCWAYFDVVFPPNQDVHIKVSYIVSGYGYGFEGRVQYTYVLRTGVGWKDTIGKGDIVARLPYDVSELNVSSCHPEDCVLAGKEISWHFEDFEPQENIELEIIKPTKWERILEETDNTKENPSDGDAWGRLANAYKDAMVGAKWIYWDHTPDKKLLALSIEAYQKATELLPNDADLHYEYADLLCNLVIYPRYIGDKHEDWVACITMLKTTLEIDPDHEEANELIEWINNVQDAQYLGLDYRVVDLSGPEPDYLVLTPQPTVTPAMTRSWTLHPPNTFPTEPTLLAVVTKSPPTRTAMPRHTPSPTVPPPSPERPNSGLIVGAAFLAAVVIAAYVIYRRRN